MVGLSLGVIGVFYFYLGTRDSNEQEAAETCGTQVQECEVNLDDAQAILDPAALEVEKLEVEKTEIESAAPPAAEPEVPVKIHKKKARSYNFRLIDTNGDGKADSVDVDLDGEADYVLGDLDGDGTPDFADLDGDTVSDVIFYDDNKDGLIDTFDIDMNQRPNGIFVDLDGDGFAEAAVLQEKTQICYSQTSGLKQMRSLTVRTAALSDYLARGAKLGDCSQFLAQQQDQP